MTETTYTTAQIAEFIDESIDNVRNWRRLPADHPRHLAGTRASDSGDAPYLYKQSDFMAWLQRPENRRYTEVILGAFAPKDIRAGLFGVNTLTTPTTENETTE